MKNISSICVILISFIWTACSNDLESQLNNSVSLVVSIPTSTCGVASRTSMAGSKASFISGDKIGVSETLAGRNNTPFTYDGTSWSTTTPLYWRNGTAVHTFYAYYPYSAASQGLSAVVPILSSQRVSTTPDPLCDMLVTPVAYTQTRSSGTSVPLTLSHTFALLRFDINMSILNLLNPYVLDSLILRGGNTSPGTSTPYGMFNHVSNTNSINYSFSSSLILLPINSSATCSQVFSAAPSSTVNLWNTTTSVYALILPGSYNNPVPAVKMVLHTLGLIKKNTGYLTLPNASSFKAGNMYIYTVSIGLNTRSATDGEGNCTLLPSKIVQ